jgi:hypothetical protein
VWIISERSLDRLVLGFARATKNSDVILPGIFREIIDRFLGVDHSIRRSLYFIGYNGGCRQ